MNSYDLTLQHAALTAAHENRRVYIVRTMDGFDIERQFPCGFACVEVLPNGQTREIAGPGPRMTFGVGNWTGD